MKKLAKKLSERLRSLREAKGLSQQELATGADVSMSLVSKLEQGKKADPRVSTVLALASALGVTPGDLLNDLFARAEPRSEGPPEAAAPPAAAPEGAEAVGNGHPAGKGKKKGKRKRKQKNA
jgi:transcriptional regulator with XRE-family HTH domain